MDPNDLLKMLDLEGRPPDTPTECGVVPPAAGDGPPSDASPTALDVDAWGLRQGRELVTESERLQKSGTDPFAAADYFSAAFDPDPKLASSCADRRRHQFVAQLLDTPEYHALHAATRLDDTAAAIAATHFAEQFAKLKKEDTKDHSGGATGGSGDSLGEEMATLRAVGRAVAEAGKEVSELHEAAGALGMGPGSPGSNDPRAVATLFKRVRPGPRRICELARRFRRVAQSKQRMKQTHGRDDVVGVEIGRLLLVELARLVLPELARLVLPELELDTLRRIAERQAACREHHAVEPVGKGPVITSIDESGPMEGEKAHAAKALALACVARHQLRWCALVAYSGDSGERLLSLPPGRWDEMKLADWLAAFIGRGSDLDVPVRELPRMYADLKAPPGVTDLIFVTDAKCRISTTIKNCFLERKAAVRARLVTLVVDNVPGDLAHVSDEVHAVRSLAPDSVGRVLSL